MDDYLRVASEDWHCLLSSHPIIDISSATVGDPELHLPLLVQFIHTIPWVFVRKNEIEDRTRT
jgi:hypothetical protein